MKILREKKDEMHKYNTSIFKSVWFSFFKLNKYTLLTLKSHCSFTEIFQDFNVWKMFYDLKFSFKHWDSIKNGNQSCEQQEL